MMGLLLGVWLASVGFGAPPVEVSGLAGTWQLNWERSRGTSEMMVAQGYPGFIVSLARGTRIRQRLVVEGAQVRSEMALPLGRIREVWIVDGQWREQRSRAGRHRMRATAAGDVLTLVREFETYTLTESYQVVGGVLRSHRTLDRDGDVVEATRVLQQVATGSSTSSTEEQ